MRNRSREGGAVLFFVLIAMVALGGVISAMAISSLMTVQSAKNYRRRVESYYAADGLVTKLAQLVIDGDLSYITPYCPGTAAGSRGTGIDSSYGGFRVRYVLTRMDVGGTRYKVQVKAFQPGQGTAGDSLYATSLDQDVARVRMTGWAPVASDTVVQPVTFYDFRYSGRSPDFGNLGWAEEWASCPSRTFPPRIAGMVDSMLDTNGRKPVPKVLPSNPAYTGARNCWQTIAYRRDGRIWDLPTYGTVPFWKGSNVSCYQECINYWGGYGGCNSRNDTVYYPYGFPYSVKHNACRAWVWDSLYLGRNCDSCKALYPRWQYSTYIGRWFKPSGDTGAPATYNPETGRWSGLKRRVVGAGDTIWFGDKYDPSLFPTFPDCDVDDALLYPRESDRMENLVLYDSLIFWRNPYYLDSAKAAGEVDSLDPRFFIYRYPYKYYYDWHGMTGGDPRYDIKHMGVSEFHSWATGQNGWFNPLKKRGFKDDYTHYPNNVNHLSEGDSLGPTWNSPTCRPSNFRCRSPNGNLRNYGWTMEMHRKFVYLVGRGQSFKMELNHQWGHGCLWIFVNNKLWLDYGGTSTSAWYGGGLEADAARLGLKPDSTYWIDIFYASQSGDMMMNIETNLMAWRPTKPEARSWKRDYGPLD